MKPKELARQANVLAPYRELHSRVFGGPNAARMRTLLFASSHVGEGCSTVAGNLAIYLAKIASKRVLLLELDALHPPRRAAVPAPRTVGLSDVLAGEADRSEAIFQVPGTTLSVLSGGTVRPGLSSLLSAPAIGELLAQLKGQYDCIVADGPAVDGVPPVLPIVPHFDGVALVTQANRTRRQVAARNIESLKAVANNFLGVVLTQRRFFIPDWVYSRL